MSISVVVVTPGQPQSGAEVYEGVTAPADKAAFQTAAAAAVSSDGGFLSITKSDGNAILLNVAYIKAVA